MNIFPVARYELDLVISLDEVMHILCKRREEEDGAVVYDASPVSDGIRLIRVIPGGVGINIFFPVIKVQLVCHRDSNKLVLKIGMSGYEKALLAFWLITLGFATLITLSGTLELFGATATTSLNMGISHILIWFAPYIVARMVFMDQACKNYELIKNKLGRLN